MTPPPGEKPPNDGRVGHYTWDVHLGHLFSVEIDGLNVAGFMECSGVSIEHEMLEYAEGGLNSYTHKLPGRIKYGNITLRRGILSCGTSDLMQWFVKGMSGVPAVRKNITIRSHHPAGELNPYEWNLFEAYPVKYSGPEFKTDSAVVACESLEIAFSYMKQNRSEVS